MKSIKKDIQNVIMVGTSSMLSLIVGVGIGIIIPKFIGVEDYAYYQIYALYASFVSILHFGFINGIYLKFGSYDYDDLPQEKFRGYTKFLVITQTIISLIIIFIMVVRGLDVDRNYALLFVGINVVLLNGVTYLSYINQFTKRFFIDSILLNVQNILQILMIVFLLIFKIKTYKYLLYFVTGTNLVRILGLILVNKEMCFGSSVPIREIIDESKGFIAAGFFMMVSEWMGTIIMSIDKLFVENGFAITDFGLYSFAVSVATTVFAIINTIANVIFPYLARVGKDKLSRYYEILSIVLLFMAILVMGLFYPMEFFLDWILPDYHDSIRFIFLLFPSILFKTLITMVCANFYKVLMLTKKYTWNTIYAFVLAVVSDAIAFFIWHTMDAIAIASVISFVLWYLTTDFFFAKKLELGRVEQFKRYLLIVLSCIFLYSGKIFNNSIIAFIYYYVATLIVFVALYSTKLKSGIKIIQDMRANKEE